MSDEIVGRAAELASVESFLDEVLLGPCALLLEGDAGAGKTTIWRATIAAARERGYRVLACHPAESEGSLAFAALGDLLVGVLDEPHPALPEPQFRALKVAVLLADPEGPPPDQRAVSVATLGVLRSLSERWPVVVAIDDIQWIDRATARVLEFALRRLECERVGVAVSVRPAESAVVPSLLERLPWRHQPHRVALAPLDPGAIDTMCRSRLGASLARPVLTQVVAASGGNPLFALEIARGILLGEIEIKPGERLSVPATLQQLVGERLADLPADVRDLLFAVAAVSDPTMALLQGAAEDPTRVRAGVEIAVRAGTVEVVGDQLRFTHPLFASTLYHAVGPERRRMMHLRLARLVTEGDERARQLALGTEGPDAAVAAALDIAARRAALRGAPDAAAELCEQAYVLTPDGDDEARHRRGIEAAEFHFSAGNPARARQWLEEIAAALDAGPVRASVLRRLAKVRYRSDSCSVAAQLLTRALEEAGDDASLRAGVERDLAWALTLCGDVRDAAQHARSALHLVRQTDDVPILAELLAATSMADFLLGDGVSSDDMRQAIELEDARSEAPIEWRPTMMRGMIMKWSGNLGDARHAFDRLHQGTREAGEETSLPFLLSQMSETATWAGDWTSARQYADEAHTIALQTGQELIRSSVLYTRALVEAHLGLLDEARHSALAGLDLAKEAGSVLAMMLNQTVLGFVELSLDEPASAHGYLAPLVAWSEVVGIREPGVLRFMPDEVEALVALGELDKADQLLAAYEADAARLDRTWAILAGARCRALHTAAAGDLTSAGTSLRRTLELTGADVPPFERARALLVLGTIERRTRRRRDSRASLEGAMEIFEHLGAKAWLLKVGRMLGSSGRHPPGQLTTAEQRVAGLVAEGATNREAADQLFVSVRAVEVHLTSIYRKLGIRSRTQLARRIATNDTSERTPPGAQPVERPP
ncbi:LuxR family transcriptional regulator [soil metagenome]